MDNKGQVLVFFVLLIPILLLGAVYIVDNVYISYHTNKLNGINSLIIKDASINDLTTDEIKEYIRRNDQDIEVEFVNITDSKLEIKLSKKIKSLFGIIIGKDFYTLTSSKQVNIENNKDIPIYQ